MQVNTIGLDVAKSVFEVHGMASTGETVLRKRLRRHQVESFFAGLPPCTVGIEACGSAHHWGRLLEAQGHRVRLLPPHRVKAYGVPGKKNDAADAAAICEAAARPYIKDVPIKSVGQQASLVPLKVRDALVRDRTRCINRLRGHLAEFGLCGPRGIDSFRRLMDKLHEADDATLPEPARLALLELAAEVERLDGRIGELERQITAGHRQDEVGRRLATIPGVGPLTATALVASIGDAGRFRSGRSLAAWLGLVPRQISTGGKTRLGSITKKGDKRLRALLVLGATAAVSAARRRPQGAPAWMRRLIDGKPPKVAAVAVAAKMARIAWALMVSGDSYHPAKVAAVPRSG